MTRRRGRDDFGLLQRAAAAGTCGGCSEDSAEVRQVAGYGFAVCPACMGVISGLVPTMGDLIRACVEAAAQRRDGPA